MRITVWPNGLGCTVKHNTLLFEVWKHGAVARLRRDNHVPCGAYGTHHTRIAPGEDFHALGREAVRMWLFHRKEWKECQ